MWLYVSISFNGATTMVSWKARRRIRRGRSASSTMLQWGHDDGVVEGSVYAASATVADVGFNGATTMVSWKAAIVRPWRGPT